MNEELIRYGVRWKSATEPLCVPMGDGYWTPWHLAQHEIDAIKAQKAELVAALELARESAWAYESEYGGSDTDRIDAAIAKAKGGQS